jgi:outer membrane protein
MKLKYLIEMRTLFVLLFGLAAIAAQGQTTQKIGYADWEYIFSQLPDYKQIDNELKTHSDQLQNQLKAKYTEYQTKLNAYNGLPSTTPEAIKADKAKELQQLQESIQAFQQEAQTSLQKKQGELMDPVYAKVGKAIGEVAKENGFTFIINPQVVNGGDILLYMDDKFNISVMVLKKLGIATPAPPATSGK